MKNEKIEQSVLGAILIESSAMDKVSMDLKSEMFSDPINQAIYAACHQLYSENKPVDVQTVIDRLRSESKDINWAVEVTGATFGVASSANIEYHAGLVRKYWMLREGTRISGEAWDRFKHPGADPQEILEWQQNALFLLQSNQLQRSGGLIGDYAHQYLDKVKRVISGKLVPGIIRTGLKGLDSKASIQNGDLVIVAARPAMGKTSFTKTVALNTLEVNPGDPQSGPDKDSGYVLFHSLEMSNEQLVAKAIANRGKLDNSRLRTIQEGFSDQDFVVNMMDQVEALSGYNLIIDDTPGINEIYAKAKAREYTRRYGKLKLIIYDYLQLMTSSVKKGSREQEIAHISRSLKGIAKEFDVPVIALSQLSRAVETRGGDKRPMLSDLRESGAIEQDADIVMFLFRPEYYGLTTYEDGTSTQGIAEIIIAKQRNGPTGKAKAHFHSSFTLFEDYDSLQEWIPSRPPVPSPSEPSEYDLPFEL